MNYQMYVYNCVLKLYVCFLLLLFLDPHAIYFCLVDRTHDLDDNEEIYDHVYQEDDDEIYEDLCSTRRHRRESSVRMKSYVLF